MKLKVSQCGWNTYTDLVYQIHPCILMKDNSWNQQDTEWSYNLGAINVQPFECFVGPKTFIADNPLEIFQLFFSDEMLDGIVDASNEYAKVTMPAEKFRKWEKYTLNDFKAYLGFQTLMSINRLPSYTDY